MLGGIGAILWAMRDRLVSVTLPREPEPPALRRPSQVDRPPAGPSGEASGTAPPPNVTDVSGIGPVYATRLEAAGVATVSDLAESQPDRVAEAAEVTVTRARGWIESARDLLA